MIMMRYVLRSLNVLNGLLLAAIAAFVYFAVIPVLNPAARMSLPPVKEPSAPSVTKAEPYKTLSPGEYALVSDQTLFHPERKIPPEKPADKAVPKPDLFLQGTLITGEGSFAFVEDRKASPPGGGRDKRQLTLRKGATLGGYLLSEVEADRIVLVKGDERVVVMLNDREKRRVAERPAAPAASAAVSSAPAASSLPKTNASAAPGIGQIVPRSPQSQPLPQKTQAADPANQQTDPARGIGGSGVWPPTRSTVEQTRQKLQEAQQIRAEQLRSNSATTP